MVPFRYGRKGWPTFESVYSEVVGWDISYLRGAPCDSLNIKVHIFESQFLSYPKILSFHWRISKNLFVEGLYDENQKQLYIYRIRNDYIYHQVNLQP